MRSEALVFLRDAPEAQRLVVAWPLVGKGRHADVCAWARLADVHPLRAEQLAPVLRAHGICQDKGVVDPLADRYIALQLTRDLQGGAKGVSNA